MTTSTSHDRRPGPSRDGQPQSPSRLWSCRCGALALVAALLVASVPLVGAWLGLA